VASFFVIVVDDDDDDVDVVAGAILTNSDVDDDDTFDGDDVTPNLASGVAIKALFAVIQHDTIVTANANFIFLSLSN
jgi:hypothetical protein